MIALNGFYVPKDYPEHLQRIRLKDLETDDAGVPDQQHDIAGVDHRRALQKPLTAELLSKWIKQHLRIKKFLGTNENAVKTQIWCAVCTHMLIVTVKKELQLDGSLYTLLQILSVLIFEKIEI